ncbi:MAG: HGGxSTG domain-containing protein, partial [Rhodospirillales bacterium]
MIRKGNVTIGLQTRFGPDWTGIRCGARTKLGGECQRPAVKKTGRCTRHGGKSTGPRTQAGRNKIAALHTTHGKYTKAKRREAQKSAEVGRKVRAEIKL